MMGKTVSSEENAKLTKWLSYRFRSDVEQVSSPVVSAATVGRLPRVDQLYIEGVADGDAGSLDLDVWAGSGNVGVDDPAVEIRLVDGVAEQRVAGGDWLLDSGGAGACRWPSLNLRAMCCCSNTPIPLK